jgi:citrate lyase subunit beta/citryl-CoA lyase
VDIVNTCFAPTTDEIEWAQRIVAAFSEAAGSAVRVDDRMVDRPVLLKAEAILRERVDPRD